jgi:hypothetical protein
MAAKKSKSKPSSKGKHMMPDGYMMKNSSMKKMSKKK